MRHERQSVTAEGVAVARALEQLRPPRERILDDPYAADFTAGLLGAAAHNPVLGRIAASVIDAAMPGMLAFVNVRGRYSDDLVAACAREGARQFLVLGAGFDTAALRLTDAIRALTTFEVDHPATQQTKRTAVQRIAPEAARRIRFVAVDFERDDLVERLTLAGFDPKLPSVATWMGVSYYLTEAAIAETLSRLARLLSPGSRLAFDLVTRATIDGTTRSRTATFGTRRAAKLGEPFIFGRDPDEVASLVEPYGFAVADEVTPAELVRRYVPGRRRSVDFAYLVTLVRR
jgi:methyltransferase (TIGR00027 family)